jgi:putative oxidoreductase
MSTKAIAIENGVAQSRALNVALWAVQIGAATMFLMAGFNKVSGNEQMVGLFQAIGIGQWFRYLTGSLEIIGAILLFVPTLSGLGGLLLTGVMVGAVATHFFIIGGNPTMAIVLLLASGLIAWGRRNQTLKLIGR